MAWLGAGMRATAWQLGSAARVSRAFSPPVGTGKNYRGCRFPLPDSKGHTRTNRQAFHIQLNSLQEIPQQGLHGCATTQWLHQQLTKHPAPD